MRETQSRLCSLVWMVVVSLITACAPDGSATPGSRSGQVPDGSGVIQVATRTVSSLYGGRVSEVLPQEGDSVAAGQVLVVMDSSLLDHQIAVAQAEVALAEARQSLAEAGARPGTVVVAQAQLEQVRAAHDAARQALTDTLAIRNHPQEILWRVALSEAAVDAAEARHESAVREKDAAELLKLAQERAQSLLAGWQQPIPPPELPEEVKAAIWNWWKSWVGVNAAKAGLDGARAALRYWQQVQDHPSELEAQVDLARATVEETAAQLKLAEAQLELTRAGPSGDQMEILAQGLTQAEAALRGLLARREEISIHAPVSGRVDRISVRAGEVVAPGAPLMSVTHSGDGAELVMFISEAELGKVSLGQQVTLTVDAFPDRQFAGAISRIADEAEYTPRTVSTKDQRVNTVFEVTVRVTDVDRVLRSGMTADAFLQDASSGEPLVLPDQTGSQSAMNSQSAGWSTSGVIQAYEVRIAAETNGTSELVLVADADRVEAGAPLIKLANTDLLAQLEQARAAVAAAEAEVREVSAGPTPQQVAVLQARVEVARSKRDKAHAVWRSSEQDVIEQREVAGQLLSAQTSLALAQQQAELSKAALEQARSSSQAAAFGSLDRQVLELRAEAAEWSVAAAEADVEAAQATVDYLNDLIANPLGLRALANRSKGEFGVALAAGSVAEAELADAAVGATQEDRSVAQARLRVAEARLKLAEYLVDRLSLRAPGAGTVLSVSVHDQETVVAGATLMTVADLTDLRLTVFVPQTELGKVKIGQEVKVVVDSYPGSEFRGRVLSIADEAEYTPRNVATEDGRTNTVFAVQIGLANTDGRLKPGMAADVTAAE